MAETGTSDENVDDVPSYAKRTKHVFHKERNRPPLFLKRNEIEVSDESDPGSDDAVSDETYASRNCLRNTTKKKGKSTFPLNYSTYSHVDSPSCSRVPYAKKKVSGRSSLPARKKAKYSSNAESPDRNNSFPSFLQAISIGSDSSSESESSSKKSVKRVGVGTWGKRYAFQDEDSPLIESSLSDDSGINWMQKKKEEKFFGFLGMKVYRYPYQNLEVITLSHPTSIILRNYVSVHVISGNISVHGYEVKREETITLFSSKQTGLIMLKTESPEELWKKKVLFSRIKTMLKQMLPEYLVQDLLSKCHNSTIIVALKKIILPPELRFLALYYSPFFELKDQGYSQHYRRNKSRKTIVFDFQFEELADKIKHAIQKSKIKDVPGQRILVFGNKKTGKSTLLQYLINKTLSMLFVNIYYLDTDPGQTEFTPPGVVSLSKVKAPLIGPPFLHQKQPLKMIFTGSVSPDSSPEMHERSVRRLVEFYNLKHSSGTLFVNTMGWLTGIGLETLQGVIKAVKPTIMIEVLNEEKPARLDYEKVLGAKDAKYFQINCNVSVSGNSTLHAPNNRMFCVLSYLGKCQKPYLETAYLNDIKPFCICWDIIPIYIYGKKVVPYRIVEAINASFVALCKVKESLVIESEEPCYQRTFKNDPNNECLGFGVVRAIDVENHLLYIVTPLSLEQLSNVNAIMKGNIQLPPEVFLKQPIMNTPLPFTDREKSKLRQRIPKRHKSLQSRN